MSTAWRAPIVDRRQSDIDGRDPKNAYLNCTDLNRIEGNIAYLTERLNGFLFEIQTESKTEWDESEIPTVAEIQRICDNITAIKDGYYAPEGCEEIPDLGRKNLHFADINLLEMNLFYLKRLQDCMIASFKKPGFKSGTKLYLPKGRKK